MAFLISAARVARTLAIGLWVGAMAGFAFIFAPVAFHVLGATPPFATMIATTIRALTAMGVACAFVGLVTTFALKESRLRAGAIATALTGMLALSFVEIISIVPKMEHTALHTAAYAALHRQSSALYSIVLLLGFLVLGATSTRDRET